MKLISVEKMFIRKWGFIVIGEVILARECNVSANFRVLSNLFESFVV